MQIRTGKRQSGATAIEFALVFPLFFALFYASLTYGLIFFMRMGLQHAAEDGARAALRYPVVAYASGNSLEQKRQLQLQARVAAATSVASQQASWMNGWRPPTVRANICAADVECLTTGAPGVYPDCGETMRCQLVITVSYPYREHPVLPGLPGFGVIIPNELQGRARVLLDGRALSIL